jgi:hypothetical protein
MGPVDLEFAVIVEAEDAGENGSSNIAGRIGLYKLYILECRPLNERAHGPGQRTYRKNASQRAAFSHMPTLLPSGTVEAINYLIFVDPEVYYDIEDEERRTQIAETITTLNDLLPAGHFGLIGPGPLGERSNSRLSVPITYSDICNSQAAGRDQPALHASAGAGLRHRFLRGRGRSGHLRPGHPADAPGWR